MRRTAYVGRSLPVLLIILIAGCNVYEGIYDEEADTSPEALYHDARIALQQNHPEEAVEHLRKALDNTDAEDILLRNQIRITLASAVLQVQEINVLSLKRIVSSFNGEGTAPLAKMHLPAQIQGPVCLFPPDFSRTAFDPVDSIDMERLGSADGQAALQESQTLVASVFSDDAASPFPCGNSALDDAVATLQVQGLTDVEIAEGLVDYAVSRSTVAYLNIITGNNDATFFHVTSSAGDQYVGQCFTSIPACNSTVERTIEDLTALDCTTRILQKRADLLNSTSARELADESRDSYQNVALGLENAVCISY